MNVINKPLPGIQLNCSHPLAKGLVGCWLFNEGSGIRAYDLSPYKNHGTLKNFNDVTSKDRSSQGLKFDGLDDYIDCENGTSLTPISGELTITCWHYFENVPKSYQTLISKGYKTYELNYIGDTYLRMYYGDGTDYSIAYYDFVPTQNQWYHIAVTIKVSGEVKWYVDGDWKETDTPTARSNFGGTNNLLIGKRSPYGNEAQGTIDEVRIYNRALDEQGGIKQSYINPHEMFLER